MYCDPRDTTPTLKAWEQEFKRGWIVRLIRPLFSTQCAKARCFARFDEIAVTTVSIAAYVHHVAGDGKRQTICVPNLRAALPKHPANIIRRFMNYQS